MPATKPNSNNILPFDVLGDIFSYYAVEETIHHPLETLLLVCHSWSEAALGHKSLWTNFRIYLGHYPTAKIWSARLPLRLARAGRNSPLCIDLRNFLTSSEDTIIPEEVGSDPLYKSKSCSHYHNAHSKDVVANEREIYFCPCYRALYLCMPSFLSLLAGENGRLCTRWRHVELHLGHLGGNQTLAIALSHPTPSLTTLTLNGVNFGRVIKPPSLFPDAPLLKVISFVDCTLPSFTPFDNVILPETSGEGSKKSQFSLLVKESIISGFHLGSTSQAVCVNIDAIRNLVREIYLE